MPSEGFRRQAMYSGEPNPRAAAPSDKWKIRRTRRNIELVGMLALSRGCRSKETATRWFGREWFDSLRRRRRVAHGPLDDYISPVGRARHIGRHDAAAPRLRSEI